MYLKTHKASELEIVIEECLRLMRLRAQISPDQELKIRRFHTDATKSVKADVEKYWRTRGVLQTQTEGYDSNANARLERRSRSVLERNSFDGGSEVVSRVRRGVLSLRVVRQMLP